MHLISKKLLEILKFNTTNVFQEKNVNKSFPKSNFAKYVLRNIIVIFISV